jgi:pyoluteorin transport system permease protein
MKEAIIDSVLRIAALVRKELLAILKDPRSRVSLFLPPIMQCLIFGYAATYDLSHVPYAVLDQDHSAASLQLLAALDGSRVFERIAQPTRAADIAPLIDDRRALLVIRIGQDFERQLAAGRHAEIQIIADGRNSNTAAIALAYVGAIVAGFNADWAAAHGGAAAPITTRVRAWYNANLETRWYMVPALIGTLTFVQVLMLTAMSVAREREAGTFDQLLVTPFRTPEIMVGKALPPVMIGVVQSSLILLVAQLWFRIPFAGSYVTLYGGLVLFQLAAVGIGLMLSAIVSTMQQAMLSAFLVMMPFSLLSGLTTPIGNMPGIFQIVTQANPLRYAIDLAHRVYLEAATLGSLGDDLIPMAIIATLTLSGAAWLFRHGIQ